MIRNHQRHKREFHENKQGCDFQRSSFSCVQVTLNVLQTCKCTSRWANAYSVFLTVGWSPSGLEAPTISLPEKHMQYTPELGQLDDLWQNQQFIKTWKEKIQQWAPPSHDLEVPMVLHQKPKRSWKTQPWVTDRKTPQIARCHQL